MQARRHHVVPGWIALVLVLSHAGSTLAAPPASDRIAFDCGEDTADRLAHLQLPDGQTMVTTIGGRTARRNVNSATDLHFYFAADDTFAYAGSVPELHISFEYYDAGSGNLQLQYDSSDTAPFPDDVYKLAGSVSFTNTYTWRTARLYVADAYFANRQNGGADFRIVKPGGGYFYIDNVTATIRRPLAHVLGSTHASGKYFFDPSRDYLNEGAVEIANAGMRVIKLWFTPDDPAGFYMWNSDWPGYATSLENLAKLPYWREVLRRPFEMCLLTVFEDRGYRTGFTVSDQIELEQDMYDLARHLLEEYDGTGKTFILGYHEGDWHLRGGTSTSPDSDPTPTNIQGMIDWANARQAGVTRARNDVPDSDVKVYHALEVNLVKIAMDGRPTVTNDVLPYTNCDLVSYSAYDTVITSGLYPSMRYLYTDALEYLASKMPDTDVLDPWGVPFGDNNVFVAEFGAPEQQAGWSWQDQYDVTQVGIEDGYAFGCPWIIYWEVFCNECCAPGYEVCTYVGGPNPGVAPAAENSNCRGFWLRRVDGTYSAAYDYITSVLHPYVRATTDFEAVQLTSRSFQVFWADVGADYYRVERRENDGPWEPVAVVPAGTTTAVDADCEAWNHYRYRVRSEQTAALPSEWFYTEVFESHLGADMNRDGDVDQEDFGAFQQCYTSFAEPLTQDCRQADLDGDGFVNDNDHDMFETCITGPGRIPGC